MTGVTVSSRLGQIVKFCEFSGWRPHQILPEECVPQEPHEFLETILLANEIILRDLNAISIYEKDNSEQVDLLTEFLWDDLQHLVLNMFRLPKSKTLRILSLHLHYYKFNGKVSHRLKH